MAYVTKAERYFVEFGFRADDVRVVTTKRGMAWYGYVELDDGSKQNVCGGTLDDCLAFVRALRKLDIQAKRL